MAKYKVGDKFLEIDPLDNGEDYLMEILFVPNELTSDGVQTYFVKETTFIDGVKTGRFFFNTTEEEFLEAEGVTKQN